MFFLLLISCTVHAAAEHDWTRPIPGYVIDLFKPLDFNYTGGRYENQRFAYRIFEPTSVRPGERYPILVWVNGYGERGNDNVGHLMHLDNLFTDVQSVQGHQFFVLAMQNPPEFTGWYKSPNDVRPDDPCTVLMALLAHVIARNPIDEDRIYLSGVSQGGTACWEIAMRYPDRFAAISPMASSGVEHSDPRIKSLVSLPIWAFHCTGDPDVAPTAVRETVAQLEMLGGRVALTEIPITSHDSWSPAFTEYDLMNWLLSHKKSRDVGYAPGVRPWHWWHIMPVPLAILAIVLLYFWEVRRRAAQTSFN